MSSSLNYLSSFDHLGDQQWKLAQGIKADLGITLWVFGRQNLAFIKKQFGEQFTKWEAEQLQSQSQKIFSLTNSQGVHWLIFPLMKNGVEFYSPPNLRASGYSTFRDSVGQILKANFFKFDLDLNLKFVDCQQDQIRGFLVGLNLLKYRFKKAVEPKLEKNNKIFVSGEKSKISAKDFEWAFNAALSINFCRHLVNIPPSLLDPKSYSETLKREFQNKKYFRIKTLDGKQLEALGYGLLYGVGEAAKTGPYLVHLKYRHPKAKSKKPIAFVGKGITYDTGGLNIKPSSGMRLMKKDMGGSATVAGLAKWTSLMTPIGNYDFYFAIAENAVSEKAYKPGDILKSKNGLTVEIDNTDAEGRLALADAMTMALEQKGDDEPSAIIDVATLTGAIKVGLGSDTGGLFCNDQALEKKLMKSSAAMGDSFWPMPLDQKLRPRLASPVADLVNSVSGFGGAVTAALFLESFVKNKSWAHFDIYAWNEAPQGPLAEIGASGQGVQCLAHFLQA